MLEVQRFSSSSSSSRHERPAIDTNLEHLLEFLCHFSPRKKKKKKAEHPKTPFRVPVLPLCLDPTTPDARTPVLIQISAPGRHSEPPPGPGGGSPVYTVMVISPTLQGFAASLLLHPKPQSQREFPEGSTLSPPSPHPSSSPTSVLHHPPISPSSSADVGRTQALLCACTRAHTRVQSHML